MLHGLKDRTIVHAATHQQRAVGVVGTVAKANWTELSVARKDPARRDHYLRAIVGLVMIDA